MTGASVPRSYYGQPVLKAPVWTFEIPWYFFVGGLGGASAGLAWLAELRGQRALARSAWLGALVGTGASPLLLISDLGRPERFLNMLRMLKVTSPMSVGSWVLALFGGASTAAALDALLPGGRPSRPAAGRRLPRALRTVAMTRAPRAPHAHARARRSRLAVRASAPKRTVRLRRLLHLAALPARPAAALAGMPLATYTGALIAQTAVPVWHEARRELPALFAAGAAASAGAWATALTPVSHAAPARRLALAGAAAELALAPLMERQLGELAQPYREGAARRYRRLARWLTAAGALALAARGSRDRAAAVAGGAALLAGAAAERWSVFAAGRQSARDPAVTVGPQRRRIAAGHARGASRRATTGVAAAPTLAEPSPPADDASR